MQKIDPEGRTYRERERSVALSFCPTIRPCYHCGSPVVSGYCCTYCGSADPSGCDERRKDK
jgi:hypothetical protein